MFWMGAEEFYVYGGTVQRLPCTVRDYVFSDFNEGQIDKVTAATNTAYSETAQLTFPFPTERLLPYQLYGILDPSFVMNL